MIKVEDTAILATKIEDYLLNLSPEKKCDTMAQDIVYDIVLPLLKKCKVEVSI